MPIKPASIEDANSISMLRTLGITLLEIGERHAVMMVTVDTRHSNYFGGAHGGLLATLIDTASFFPLPLHNPRRESLALWAGMVGVCL